MRRYLIAGLLIWVPLVITIWVLKLVVDMMDQSLLLLPPQFRTEAAWGVHIPGLGVVLTLAVVLVTGMLAANFIGVRLLSRKSVELMTSNHLPPRLLTGEWGIGQSIMRPGFGYGFNCAVIFDPPEAGTPDGKGTWFWDGAAGTWFWVDPTNDVVFVAMIQRMHGHDNHTLEYKSHAAVYSALVDRGK